MTNEQDQEKTDSSNTLEDKLKELEIKFKNDREGWVQEISDMARRMKEIHDIADLQVDLFSRRQVLVEKIANLRTRAAKVYQKYRAQRGDLFGQYANSQQRYSKGDINTLLEGATAFDRAYIEILETQIEYYVQTVKTTDGMIFGIKHRIELENHRTLRS